MQVRLAGLVTARLIATGLGRLARRSATGGRWLDAEVTHSPVVTLPLFDTADHAAAGRGSQSQSQDDELNMSHKILRYVQSG